MKLFIGMLAIVTACRALGAESTMTASSPVKFNGLLQAWLLNDSAATATPTFRLRRAEVKFSGSIIEKTRWFLMADFAKSIATGAITATTDTSPLNDFGIAHTITEGLEVVVGQFRLPSTLENEDSSGEILFPERTAATRRYGFKRSPAAMLVFKQSIVKVNVAVSNGEATNIVDNNSSKDLSVRVEVQPVEALKVGVFTNAQDFSYRKRGTNGLDAKFIHDAITVRGEAIQRKVFGSDTDPVELALAGDLAYQINDSFQPAIRYEYLKLDSNLDDTNSALTLGLNWYMSKHQVKIVPSATIYWNMAAANGSYTPGTSNGTLLNLALQMAI